MNSDEAARMKPSAFYNRIVDVMEELVNFTHRYASAPLQAGPSQPYGCLIPWRRARSSPAARYLVADPFGQVSAISELFGALTVGMAANFYGDQLLSALGSVAQSNDGAWDRHVF